MQGATKVLANLTSGIVYSKIFKDRTRKRSKDFTRNRKMSFEHLVLFILKSGKSSLSTAIRRFFEEMEIDETMAQQSLSEARQKLNVEGFIYLFLHATVKPLFKMFKKTWKGYFVYGTDGSKVALPAVDVLLEHFGTTGRGSKSPTAQVSTLYDVLNNIIIDAAIEPMSKGERKLALRHIDALKALVYAQWYPKTLKKRTKRLKKRIIIYDRGYASFEFIKKHMDEGLKFVMRVKSGFNTDIDVQVDPDGMVRIKKGDEKLSVRVLKFELDSGEIETLITNIYDEDLSVDDFKELYFLRWHTETNYDIIKNKLQLENFTTKTVEGIQQDFYATMYLRNFVSAAEMDVQKDIEEARADKDNKYQYKANKNEIIGILKDRLIIALAHESTHEQAKEVDKILEDAKRYVIPIRPDRRVERNPNPRRSKFHHNQKSNA